MWSAVGRTLAQGYDYEGRHGQVGHELGKNPCPQPTTVIVALALASPLALAHNSIAGLHQLRYADSDSLSRLLKNIPRHEREPME